MDLFTARAEELGEAEAPLAARMRPRTLDEMVGQRHVIGPGSSLRALIEADELRSVLLAGPPGVGKTSLAQVIARSTQARFDELSATSATVKDVRAVLAAARERLGTSGRRTILFVDEIHRFNRAQQDALLPGVEDRTVVLVGATSENPFFTVNAPLLSRSLLFRLEPLGDDELAALVRRALDDPQRGLGTFGLTLDDDALAHLVDRSDGDARHALNALETAALVVRARARAAGREVEGGSGPSPVSGGELARAAGREAKGGSGAATAGSGGPSGSVITLADVEDALQRPRVTYDRAGDQHYDVASAFIKSLRGSDPDAALHYLARMLAAGEDPRFVVRRMVILASEDVGLADPGALQVAVAAAQALELVGLPEARLNLAQAAVHLALAPKSNSVYKGLNQAQDELARPGRVPQHLQSAGHPGERRFGTGVGYRYPHDAPGHWTPQRYLPEGLQGGYYQPSDQGAEPDLSARWAQRHGDGTAEPGKVRETPQRVGGDSRQDGDGDPGPAAGA